MSDRNPLAETHDAAVRRAGLDRMTPGRAAPAQVDRASTRKTGVNVGGNWKPCGISNITSTGEPFYSAEG